MNLDDNITKIILGIIVALGGGAWFAIKKSKRKNYRNSQSNITMTGDGNKATGGDDNSKTTFSK